MIKLFEIIKEIESDVKSLTLEIASNYIIVGMVDYDLNVISSNNIGSHQDLISKYPEWRNRSMCHWRFNANNNTLYWYEDPNNDMKDVVKSEIKKKGPPKRRAFLFSSKLHWINMR